MINVTPPTIADIEEAVKISRQDVYCSEVLSVTNIAANPWCVSLKDNEGNLGAIVGLSILRKGVALGWAVTTNHLLEKPIAYTRRMLDIIREVYAWFNIHRLQIYVKCRSDLVRWAQVLGFEIEGRMKSFGTDKSDYFIMGRVI